MILILHDTPEGYPFVAERMTMPCRKVYSPQKSRKYFTWLAGAWKAMRQSRKGDVIVSLYDFQGILCLLIGYLTFRRRHILGINLLLKDKPTAKNRLASTLYRHAVRSRWFHTTVTSKAYQQWFNHKIRLDIDYPLLRDVYYDSYEPDPAMLRECDGSVFCGGRNSRDWEMMVTLARIMPERHFCFIMPDDRYSEFEHKMPENVEALHEVPMDTFVDRMSRASVICMPVTTDAPAGLITMFQAAGYKKPIISTYTVTTSEYLTPDRGYLLPSNDAELWASTIRDIFDDPGAALKKACEFHRFATGECNEASYVSRIEEIIRGFVP